MELTLCRVSGNPQWIDRESYFHVYNVLYMNFLWLKPLVFGDSLGFLAQGLRCSFLAPCAEKAQEVRYSSMKSIT
jgi:hypothetical protein